MNFVDKYNITMEDYLRTGKQDTILKRIGVNKNIGLQILCKEEQIDEFSNNIEMINKLIKRVVPIEENEGEVINVPTGKFHKESVLRLDLSSFEDNKYVFDLLYSDIQKDYNHGSDLIVAKPKCVRYNIGIIDNEIDVTNSEITVREYLGSKYKVNIYYAGQDKDRVTIFNDSKKEYEEIEFNSIKYSGYSDDKINELLSKEFKRIIVEYINNKNQQIIINRIQRNKSLFTAFSQSNDCIIVESTFFKKYIVLDLNTYEIVDCEIIAENDKFLVLWNNDKKFVLCNKHGETEIIDYKVLSEMGDISEIEFYGMYDFNVNFRKYIYSINTKEHTMTEVENSRVYLY